MHVGGAETELAGPGFEDDAVFAEGALDLFGAVKGAVGGGVVDDYDFPV